MDADTREGRVNGRRQRPTPMKSIALLLVVSAAAVAASDVTTDVAARQGVVSKEGQRLREAAPTEAQKKEWGLWGGLRGWGCGGLGWGLGCGGLGWGGLGWGGLGCGGCI
ncbi:hypothetical protein H310_03481 [Aphanomyces invadans]|uniref:RxLR effector protein n=1 Tax=Aphanomyces invadans TaxID=157072 RepID=A0A024UIW1_9STRA|nr:hypothetical protein H310_03481 [Aphanomyces invadans]ETW05797.1 hypothetical protein H310_03481 [Aphanomyces invadans]|eukprot:XP_008865574.1 hypothetical protein H310_03481 [Aphanomyces invadans]